MERGVLDPNQLNVQFLLKDNGDVVKEFDDNDANTVAVESQVIFNLGEKGHALLHTGIDILNNNLQF